MNLDGFRMSLLQTRHLVMPAERQALKGHGPAILWFTGLSGSGKSTIANQVEYALNHVYRAHTFLLDGDDLRAGLNHDLGFTAADRRETIRRAGEIAGLFYAAGLIVITAFISPFRADRDAIRERLAGGNFIEIYVDCPLAVCEDRDPKGLYRRARAGPAAGFHRHRFALRAPAGRRTDPGQRPQYAGRTCSPGHSPAHRKAHCQDTR
jgi:adenylylsulfate kinase